MMPATLHQSEPLLLVRVNHPGVQPLTLDQVQHLGGRLQVGVVRPGKLLRVLLHHAQAVHHQRQAAAPHQAGREGGIQAGGPEQGL
jgi:hypothetical protein